MFSLFGLSDVFLSLTLFSFFLSFLSLPPLHMFSSLSVSLCTEAAAGGELDQLRTSLSELDTDFDRRIGEKIQFSVQIGNLLIPQVRSLLLSKLAAMSEKGIDCRMEVLYPVKKVGIDMWDFVRCLGILLDNAAEGALETEAPWNGKS